MSIGQQGPDRQLHGIAATDCEQRLHLTTPTIDGGGARRTAHVDIVRRRKPLPPHVCDADCQVRLSGHTRTVLLLHDTSMPRTRFSTQACRLRPHYRRARFPLRRSTLRVPVAYCQFRTQCPMSPGDSADRAPGPTLPGKRITTIARGRNRQCELGDLGRPRTLQDRAASRRGPKASLMRLDIRRKSRRKKARQTELSKWESHGRRRSSPSFGLDPVHCSLSRPTLASVI
ncbi:hypothetical protein VUR80DRAFT_1851 [Thermomyces stellatus]